VTNYEYRTTSEALPAILEDLLENGAQLGSRNGRVAELLNQQIVIEEPNHREILSINRKANVFAQIAETCWVLAGRNDIEWLSAYLPRAKDYSDDGVTWRGGYGPRIRGGHFGFDQVEHVIDLLRADPLSRRAVIAIYDPTTDASPGKDIPCNDFLQFQSRLGELHLAVTVRSNDMMWGWSGINAFEWSTLQEIVASLLGVGVGSLTFNIGSMHLYEQHWDKARSISYEPFHGNTISFNPHRHTRTLSDVDILLERWFAWEAECRAGVFPAEPADLGDPLFNAWAHAIAYYWSRDEAWLSSLKGTALALAVARTPASVLSEAVQSSSSVPVGVGATATLNETTRAFYDFVSDLHAKKHASYGDSWKKRGEKLSILANIARKVDRLGVGDEFDSAADTWIDLMVYLAKYSCWINNSEATPENVDFLLRVALLETQHDEVVQDLLLEVAGITHAFDNYADNVDLVTTDSKRDFIRDLLLRVAPIARDVWLDGQDYRGADVD
jgi:thymidylate synthase